MSARAFAFNMEHGTQHNRVFAAGFRPLAVKNSSVTDGAHWRVASSWPPWLNFGGMEVAFTMAGNALPSAVCWHACAMHLGQELFCLCPWHSACFAWQNRMVAEGVEHLWPQFGVSRIRLLPAAMEVAAEPSEDELAQSMDIAIGACAA
jgi:hypothetical protein